MSIKRVIKEQLYNEQIILLAEQVSDTTPNNAIELIKKTAKELGLSLKFVFTFGTGIGAFLPIVKNILSKNSIELREDTIPLIIITAFALLLNNENVSQLKSIVIERGLESALNKTLKIIKGVKNIVLIVAEKLGYTLSGLTDILSFTFILAPIINLLNVMLMDGQISENDIIQLMKGVSLSSAGYFIKQIISVLLYKLRRKNNL